MRRGHFHRDELRMAYATKFAAELADILYDEGITHRELSLQLGVAHATVDSWTRVTNPKIPSKHNMLRLCEFLEKIKPGASAGIRSATGQRLSISGLGTKSSPLAMAEPDAALKPNDATLEVEEQTHSQSNSATAHPSNLLPSLTQFVGRAWEISEARRLLENVRLLSLVGIGGIGKTRLALEIARGLDCYPEGVWLVELDALRDPELIPTAIGQALPFVHHLGTLSGETIAACIGERRLLLIMDNCEHLVAACSQLCEKLLQTCPNVDILATSREILGCPGEMVWWTHALSIPQGPVRLQSGDDLPHADALCLAVAESESGQVFLARARERHSSFALTTQNAPYVAQICRRLEGIPLALELTAARITTLSVEEIAQRLDIFLQLPTHGKRSRLPRHQSLHACLQWSYDLLTPAEQVLFRRLGIFVGGWTLDAAEGVCAGDSISTGDVLNNLTQLVDKSLVIAEFGEQRSDSLGDDTRYRFLEPIRQYALQQLADSIDAETFSQRHAQFFASMIERTGEAQIVAEIDNVRAALLWATSDRVRRVDGVSQENMQRRTVGKADRVADQERTEIGLHMVGILHRFWRARGETTEGLKWTERALAHSHNNRRTAARAYALMGAVTMKAMSGQYAGVGELSAESESIFRELDDRIGLAQMLAAKGVMYLNSGRLMTGRSVLGESQALAEQVGDSGILGFILFIWGSNELQVGDVDVAERCLHKSLAISRANGDFAFGSAPLVSLARVAWLQGNYECAQQMIEESLVKVEESGNEWQIAMSQNSLADIVRCREDHAEAAALASKSLTIFRKLGDRPNTAWALYTLGHSARQAGDYQQAIACWKESLSITKELEKHQDVVLCLAALAGGYRSVGQLRRAATLFGAVDALLGSIIVRWSPYDEEAFRRDRTETQTALTEDRFKLDWEKGQTMQEADAAAFALHEQ